MKIIITEEQLTKIYSEQSIIGTLAARPPYISQKDFGQGMSQVSNLAKQGWRLISTVTRGETYKFVLEREEQ
jgi:hypothetical protein